MYAHAYFSCMIHRQAPSGNSAHIFRAGSKVIRVLSASARKRSYAYLVRGRRARESRGTRLTYNIAEGSAL